MSGNSCAKAIKPINSAEYTKDKEDKEDKSNNEKACGHTYKMPKWQAACIGYDEHVTPTNSKEYAEPKEEPKDHAATTVSKKHIETGPKKQVMLTEPKGHTKPKKHAAPMDYMDCIPGINMMAMAAMSPDYFFLHAKPIAEHSYCQVETIGIRNAIMKATLIGLLVGTGLDHQQASMIVDRWHDSIKVS